MINETELEQTNVELTAGQQLHQARKALGYSLEYVAARLRLKQSTVQDIENDINPLCLSPTFIRGYLRTYAKLVNLPESLIITDKTASACSPVIQREFVASGGNLRGFPLNKEHTRKNRDSWLMRLTWLILLGALGLTCAWWWQNYTSQGVKAIPALPSVQVSQNNSSSGIINLSLDDNGNETTQVAKITHSGDLILPVELQRVSSLFPNRPATLTAKAMAEQRAQANILTLEFIANCWVDIRDSDNNLLANGVQKKGTTLTLTGTPPYLFKLGAPNGVKIEFKGKMIEWNKLAHDRKGFLVLPEK